MAFESMIWQNKQAPLWGTIVVVFTIVTVLMLISLFVEEISDVLDVTSTLGGSFVIFIIPASFIVVINYKEKKHWTSYILPVVTLLMGTF